jgi:hypothetical protein
MLEDVPRPPTLLWRQQRLVVNGLRRARLNGHCDHDLTFLVWIKM